MDFFEVKELFEKTNLGKKIDFEFDEKCHRVHELIYTDGQPNPIHHIENNKVKITIENKEPIYVNILPHRECATWKYIKNLILSKKDPVDV